jgi:hypothetical protein
MVILATKYQKKEIQEDQLYVQRDVLLKELKARCTCSLQATVFG